MDREILEKTAAFFAIGKRLNFAFVHAEKASYPISALCKRLGVSRQGYYAYANRGPSPRHHVRLDRRGGCYLAAMLDLFSRCVVGWAMDLSPSTRLPLSALEMAVNRRRPSASLLHHSDRGCQCTSAEYRSALAELGVDVSMSRKGNCWDDAVAESFFATSKTELVYGHRWTGRHELRAAVLEYIETFSNRRRLHSSLGYKAPVEVENEYAAAQAA